ncbi:MAG: Gfo/Idh/MocA family oxidoreductase, partial [Clostridia bacterium]|nr:Gfo/Idh/MocA family oxidoreductase [Clostridia bacterium]
MDRIKTAVIGTGKVARCHAEALKALPESDFTAVYGRDIAKARAFAASLGDGIQAYDSIPRMIREAGVGAVVVCTPHPAHAAPAVEAARAGAHVLVEKPLAVSLADCDAMIRAAREAGVLRGGVSQRRFYRPVRRIRDAIDAGRIGRPVLGTV